MNIELFKKPLGSVLKVAGVYLSVIVVVVLLSLSTLYFAGRKHIEKTITLSENIELNLMYTCRGFLSPKYSIRILLTNEESNIADTIFIQHQPEILYRITKDTINILTIDNDLHTQQHSLLSPVLVFRGVDVSEYENIINGNSSFAVFPSRND